MCDDSILLMLVDAETSGGDVLEMVQQLRSRSDVSLIVLSALAQRTDLAAMLESGADDCISGPIEPGEMAARVVAVLQKERSGRTPARQVLEVAGIQIASASRMVRVGGIIVDLTSIEYDILEYLARDAGNVVSRDELMTAVCRRDASPLDRSLDVHISHLRRKLQHHRSQIRTVRGVGYMLAAVGR